MNIILDQHFLFEKSIDVYETGLLCQILTWVMNSERCV